MSTIENIPEFVQENVQHAPEKLAEQSKVELPAKQRRSERYREAAQFFEAFDELNLEYHAALQEGNAEKVTEAIARIQARDLRAEGERIKNEADALYVKEKADQDARHEAHVDKIRSAMASIKGRQAA